MQSDATALFRTLTERERAVLAALHADPDASDEQLGDRLGIRPSTMRSFLRLIRGKLGISTRAGLCLWWERLLNFK